MTRTARCTVFLVMVNLAVYLVVFGCWVFSGGSCSLMNAISDFLALPSSLRLLASRPWTIITFMFTQFGFIHLIANMLWLVGFGGMMKTSPGKLLAVYLSGGLSGAIFYLLYTLAFPGNTVTLIGASASVIAVVLATTILSPNRSVGVLWFWEVKLKWLAPIALITIFGGSAGAVCTHLGGVFAGICASILLRYLDRIHSERSLMQARKEMTRLKREARRSAIIAKAGSSGFASLTDAERLEIFNLSRQAAGE